jgi:hypothetical protein
MPMRVARPSPTAGSSSRNLTHRVSLSPATLFILKMLANFRFIRFDEHPKSDSAFAQDSSKKINQNTVCPLKQTTFVI